MVDFTELKHDVSVAINEINQYEKIRLIGGIASFKSYGVKGNHSLPNIEETTTEYVMSIALASSNNSKLQMPSAEELASIYAALARIREKYITYILESNDVNPLSISKIQNLRVKAMEKALTIRGIGYRIHIEEIFLELFAIHGDFLMNHFNFKASDILDFIYNIEDFLVENRIKVREAHKEFLSWFEKQDFNRLSYMYGVGDSFLPSKIYQLETGYVPEFAEVHDQYRLLISEMAESQKSFVEKISMQFEDNVKFLDPKFASLPLNDTLINSKPILYNNTDGTYYCFLPDLLHRNIFDIVEVLINSADSNYY
jgi:hypothetical protein